MIVKYKVKTVVGYSFTDKPIQRLRQAGFSLIQNDHTLNKGYREFVIPLADSLGLGMSLEIREVLDEELYFAFQKKREFVPFVSERQDQFSKTEHLNKSICINAIYDQNLPDSDLKSFLKIRKIHPIRLVIIKCKEDFFKQNPNLADQSFKWNHKEAALIHLGQNCYDLLMISE